ncbi:hypothetical protein [Polaribacter sp. IC073]|uniref:hypothetical protein n=1 Tax=Polaribacter sp. IC073 TaxID=2508540 RepID=UPI0011BEF38C|nr:hypothetical protein [Polaribacter sp. IC073]TXD47326.1 hypothetical protein ES045_12065 [Polaribacter sp. IC073]
MNLQERIIKYQTENTPAPDKLAHYYWGNKWWAFLGSATAILILATLKLFLTVNYWFIPLIFLPYITALLAAKSKEKRDSTGLGTVEKLDVKYTVSPSYLQCFFLLVIIFSSMP